MNSPDSNVPSINIHVDGVSAEEFVLMLNMGWSLRDITAQAGIPAKTVEQIIVAEVRRERLAARISS